MGEKRLIDYEPTEPPRDRQGRQAARVLLYTLLVFVIVCETIMLLKLIAHYP